ncbi:DUF2971 domain-containing protein [Clostridium sporogenes]|uniref:DUF2971 domain-containing protein n=1 Tax=Clostridium sporogenes TaxID=1509 RepID=UPI0022378280|nr:DUF2971 domain-containing protein [Clostridium sporogenes]MCW6088838.1 DUF2971 domain-containing protein [Clostridium sporogenes]
MENKPEYLYQYTRIETLALILGKRCIKFNSLQNVDDLEEMEAEDIKNFGKYAFVSCWTNDENENIALWNMYTEKMKGVRIKLPYNCLKDDCIEIKKQLVHSGNKLLLIPQDPWTDSSFECFKVNYTDIKSELFPKVWEPKKSKEYPLVLNKLGKNKSAQWAFQKEWRYIIYTQLNNWLNNGEDIETGRKRLENFEEIPEGIYVGISDDAFKKMEIMLGPKTSKADMIIVKALVDKYNKGIKVSKSGIKINNR